MLLIEQDDIDCASGFFLGVLVYIYGHEGFEIGSVRMCNLCVCEKRHSYSFASGGTLF